MPCWIVTAGWHLGGIDSVDGCPFSFMLGGLPFGLTLTIEETRSGYANL
jgi:hypothetical protein